MKPSPQSGVRAVFVPKRVSKAKGSHVTGVKQEDSVSSPVRLQSRVDMVKVHKSVNDVAPPSIVSSVQAEQRATSTKVDQRALLPLSNSTTKVSTDKVTAGARWTTKKKIVAIVITSAIVLTLCTAAIVVAVVLLHVRRSQSSSVANQTVSTCSSTTCIGSETPYRTSIVTALYPFDNNCNDLSGYLSGVAYGSSAPTYSTGTSYINQAIDLDPANRHYIRIPSMNVRQRSFTIQLWLFVRSSASGTDFALLSQCGNDSICLSISIRNSRIALSFDSMNSSERVLTGTTVIVKSYWYHITVVYDSILKQQLIYVNGRIDSMAHGVEAYQGTLHGAMTYIASNSSVQYRLSFFHGFIDHLTISAGVSRTACQILNDATLIVYYPFDNTNTLLDHSVYLFHGVASSCNTELSGRRGQSISFQTSGSYFQSNGFPTMRPGTLPLSISLWIKPTATVSGASLVHVSSLQNGTSSDCYDLLGFSSSGALVAQLMTSVTTVVSTSSVTVPANVWTHVAFVYSSTHGLRLFVNGQLASVVTGSMVTNSYNMYLTLGNNSPGLSTPSSACVSSTVVGGAYRGAIDEFRIYNRELNADELCVLANI